MEPTETASPQPARTSATVRAIVADDERLLRDQLRHRLQQVWPDLQIVAEARNGLEAVELVQQHQPDVVFLDIRMPGMTGVEAAREILQMDLGPDDWLPEIVFITAYDQYAVQAFEHGAVDYVLKPAETERLARTAERLQQRLHARHQVPADPSAGGSGALQPLLSQLAAQMAGRAPQYLEFVQAASGSTVHVIPVKDVLFFMSDEKYTRVQTATVEALIRKPIKELIDELDPRQFWQIHRSAIVQLAAVQSIARDDRGRQIVSVRGHPQKLEVSRSFSGLFKGM